MAIMGTSGAGKTSFLNVVAGRNEGGVINGKICVDGKGRSSKTFNRLSAYVEQDDVLLANLTVKETFYVGGFKNVFWPSLWFVSGYITTLYTDYKK